MLDDLPEADEILCLATTEPSQDVAHRYAHFEPVEDPMVRLLLRRAETFGIEAA